MKTLNDIQELIKNKDKICVFIDFKNIIENISYLHWTSARESQIMRIIQNYANLSFIKIYVVCKKTIPQKLINKFPDITFIKYTKNELAQICSEIGDNYTFAYLGNNEDILNLEYFLKGYKFSIDSSRNNNKKNIDFQTSLENFVEFITETNNLYL